MRANHMLTWLAFGELPAMSPRDPSFRVKVFSGWRAIGVVGLTLAIIAAVFFLAFSFLIVLVLSTIVGAIASTFLPRRPVAWRTKIRKRQTDVIDADYWVAESDAAERAKPAEPQD
jgi:hypothetical protein